MVSDGDRTPETRGRAIADFSEDATGFGRVELRTAWHVIARPRDVLDAYMTLGPTGGGRYARPLRFYLALCGLLMLVLFLSGGAKQMLLDFSPAVLDPLIARSGKSRELFLSDADNWISLVLVPISSGFYALGVAPLLKAWDRSLDWRRAFRAAFAFLSAWTILLLPFSGLVYQKSYVLLNWLLMLGFLAAAFIRMGRGRWWRTWPGAVGKTALLALSTLIFANISMIPVMAIGLLGAVFYG